MAVDLHLHTKASDGALAPEELVELASNLNLVTISITDHDNVEGIDAAVNAGKRRGVEVIPGVEMSSDLNGRDVHILGYFIDHHDQKLVQLLKRLREARQDRALKMVDRLREMGLDIYLREVIDMAGEGSLGRAHIAKVLLKKGYIHDIQEAFDRYIGRGMPGYVGKKAYSPAEIIAVIRSVGGVPILAHPGISNVDDYISDFVVNGLQGLEAYHSEHSQEQTELYKNRAEEMGIIVTGGSDCHGLGSSRGLIIGSVYVPDKCLDDLKKLKFVH